MPSLTKVQTGFMEAQGALPLSSGTAAAPGLKFDDHAGTGMFSPSTGEIAFSTSGHSQAVTFKTDGKVGIGAANNSSYDINAQNLLLASSGNTGMTIRSAGSTPFAMIHFADGTSGQAQQRAGRIMYQHDGDSLTFHTANTEKLRIDTTAVKTSTEIWIGGSATPVLRWRNGGSEYATARISSGGDLYFEVTNTERLRITAAGNIGVGGLTNPGALLSIPAGESNTPRLAIESAVDDNDFTITQYEDGNGTYTMLGQNVKLNVSGNITVLDSGHKTAGILLDARSNGNITFYTGNDNASTERLRVTSDGKVGINATEFNALLTIGPVSSPTFNRGAAAFKAVQDDNSLDACLYLEEASGAEGYTLSVASNGELNFHNSGASPATLKLGDDNLVTVQGFHATANVTPTTGRGVEIFAASAGVGQISSFNRTGGSWDELRLKGSEVAIYTGTSNGLGLYLQSTASTLYGTSDGIFNLDTTDARGAFIRFKETGTSKAWIGCSEGIGTGGDQDDLGLRAVGDILLRAGARKVAKFFSSGAVSFHVNSDSHETFRFSTQAANEAKLIMKDASSNSDIVLNTGGDSWFQGGNVGIGTAPASTRRLHVKDSNAIVKIEGTTSYAQVEFTTGSTSSAWIWRNPSSVTSYGGANSLNFYQTENAGFAFFTNAVSSPAMLIAGNGIVTKPKNPSFQVGRNQSNWTVAGNTKFDWDLVVHNIGSHFSTSNDRFTAPVAGSYQFNFSIIWYEATLTNEWVSLRKNGNRFTGGDLHFSSNFGSNKWHHISYSSSVYLNSGDYVEMFNGGSASINYHGNQWGQWSGYLVG